MTVTELAGPPVEEIDEHLQKALDLLCAIPIDDDLWTREAGPLLRAVHREVVNARIKFEDMVEDSLLGSNSHQTYQHHSHQTYQNH